MKNFLGNLNEKQKEAVLHTEGPLLIFAGAGTGKTRVITYRIAYLLTQGIPPENILAITFTNKAAEEMKTRVTKLCPVTGKGVWISTFHSFAARILRIEAEKIGLDRNFVIYDESDQKNLIKECLKELSIDEKKYKVGALQDAISRAKDDLIDPGSYIIYTVATNDYLRQIIAKVYHLYQRKLAQNNALDFGDLLLKLNDVLHNIPEIREKYQNRFKYILVDEYQDTNRAQYVLIKHLSARHKNLCVVGDDDQCFPEGTKIITKNGYQKIENIQEGSFVLSCVGNGKTTFKKVLKKINKKYSGKLIKIKTKLGNIIRATPNHIFFTSFVNIPDKFFVYLMYRHDYGYRIGFSKSVRSDSRRKIPGLRVRANQENAEKIWILRVCDSKKEAQYFEHFYSVKYEIPTMVFKTSRDMKITQKMIEQLYREIDSNKNVKKLSDDLLLDLRYPHHIPQATIRNKVFCRNCTISIFGGPRIPKSEGAWCYHRLSINSSDKILKEKIQDRFGDKYQINKGKRNTWKLEICKKNYLDLASIMDQLRNIDKDIIFIEKIRLLSNRSYNLMSASNLRKGMTLVVYHCDKLVEDEIVDIDVEDYQGSVYDLSIEDTLNYISEGIVVHNSIYSWRGANIQNILGFEKDFSETKVLKLEQNYRSTKNILDCAWRVIKNNVYRKDKKLWTENPEGEEVKFFGFENEIEEAQFIAKEIKKLKKENDYKYKDFAVFYRTNAQSRVLEDAFRKEKIPYNIVGTVRFYDRKEIKDILSYLRVVVNPGDSLSLKRIINVPHRGIGENTVKKLEEYAHRNSMTLWETLKQSDKTSIKNFIELIENFRKAKKSLSAVELTKKILKETGYIEELEQEKTYQSKERIFNLKEFVSAVSEYTELNKTTDIESFLADISLMSDIDTWNIDKPGSDAVTLMTLHLAKGLEFDIVFITGLEEGLFPISSSLTEENVEELEEERRLCYVGMTRAKTLLYMTYSEMRHLFGQIRWNLPSRFLQEAKIEEKKEIEKDRVPSKGFSGVGSFRCGQKVRHSEFGVGRIIKIVGRSDNLKLVVLFEQGGVKKLLAKYANLEYEN